MSCALFRCVVAFSLESVFRVCWVVNDAELARWVVVAVTTVNNPLRVLLFEAEGSVSSMEQQKPIL